MQNQIQGKFTLGIDPKPDWVTLNEIYTGKKLTGADVLTAQGVKRAAAGDTIIRVDDQVFVIESRLARAWNLSKW